MNLRALTLEDCQLVRRWREDLEIRAGLRSPYISTEVMQDAFYERVVSCPESPHRYWAVCEPRGTLVAMAGLTHIQWENGLAELSLIIDPMRTNQGIGSGAILLVLTEAFERMRLLTVCGEVYQHNSAVHFWRKMVDRYYGDGVILPRRKFWNGALQESWYFFFTAEGYDKWKITTILP